MSDNCPYCGFSSVGCSCGSVNSKDDIAIEIPITDIIEVIEDLKDNKNENEISYEDGLNTEELEILRQKKIENKVRIALGEKEIE